MIADVYHSPLPRGPLTPGSPPFVVTVHDLVPIRFPETTTRWSRLYSAITFHRVLAAADRIIVPSQNTADDLDVLAHVPVDRIRVVPTGVDEMFFSRLPAQPPSAKPYVLFVGTPEPRKNLVRLVSAMTLLRSRGLRERLVIVGAGGWGPDLPASENVQMLGRVSDGGSIHCMRRPPVWRCHRSTRGLVFRRSRPWPPEPPWSRETVALCRK